MRCGLCLLAIALVLAACSGDEYTVKSVPVQRGLELQDAGLDPVDPPVLSSPVAWAEVRDADSVQIHFSFLPESGDAEQHSLALERLGGESPGAFDRWEIVLPARSEGEALEYWFEAWSPQLQTSWPAGAPQEQLRVEAEPLVVDFPWPDWPEPEFDWPETGDISRVLDGAEDEDTLIPSAPFDVIREPIWKTWSFATVQANNAGVRDGIGVEHEGQAWFFPKAVLLWNELANVTLGSKRSGVSYCPLTDTALHFDSGFDPEALPKWHDYAPAGLFNSNLIVAIEKLSSGSASPFSQMLGLAFSGPQRGRRMKALPSVLIDINVWARLHPETLVLEGDPASADGFDYLRRPNPYDEYWRSVEVRFPVARTDDRLGPKQRVVGVVHPEDSVVVPMGQYTDFVHHTTVAGIDVIIHDTSTMAIALHAKHPVTGEPLRLRRVRTTWRELPLFEDESADPGLWTMEGVALTGPARGMRLAWVPSMSAFWFAWYAMYPEARFELPETVIDPFAQ